MSRGKWSCDQFSIALPAILEECCAQHTATNMDKIPLAMNESKVDIVDDFIDELEAELLGKQAPAVAIKAAAEKLRLAEEAAQSEEKNPLIDIFLGKEIRVIGTVKDPLFNAADVGKYIEDVCYRQNLKTYTEKATADTGAYIHKIVSVDCTGRQNKILYLTEIGLYRYLLRSNKDKAIEFQVYVYRILKSERERVVDAVQLAMKIVKNLSIEQLREERAKSLLARNDADRAMRVANDLREENRKLKTQAARGVTDTYNRERQRLLALEEENRKRGPFETAHRF